MNRVRLDGSEILLRTVCAGVVTDAEVDGRQRDEVRGGRGWLKLAPDIPTESQQLYIRSSCQVPYSAGVHTMT